MKRYRVLTEGSVAQRAEKGGPILPCHIGDEIEVGAEMAAQLVASGDVEPADEKAKPKKKAVV